ncbi:MAG: DUF1223 domain-containing protein [Burkholderiaceae bacterium]
MCQPGELTMRDIFDIGTVMRVARAAIAVPAATAAAVTGVFLSLLPITAAPARAAQALAGAPACSATAGSTRVPVVELYTSEGCSSCPPADRWLAALAASALGEQVLALALHVDYWDRLGWPDRFADRRFTDRQRRLARAGGLRTIYTPQVVVDGRDFPRWSNGPAAVARLAASAREPSPLRLDLEARRGNGPIMLSVTVSPRTGAQAPEWTLVTGLTQDGLASDVARGENAGRRLKHDRVVRDWQVQPDSRVGSNHRTIRQPDSASDVDLRVFAMAVDAAGRPIQAVSCALPAIL